MAWPIWIGHTRMTKLAGDRNITCPFFDVTAEAGFFYIIIVLLFREERIMNLGDQCPMIEPPNLIHNPHENVKAQPKYKSAIVKGRYAYYHYGQQNVDDSGWGCAYRAFQTVCSWLKYQNYLPESTSIPPTHREIQQCLVDIGDKPARFLGSQQWIGSLELSFCLQNLYGITSKILSSKSGADLAEHARALLFHLENGGSPIMIGGGQLAHTILGVDYNPRSGECQYLVLDPHYHGSDDDIEKVLASGWCAWKPASFWNKKDFYNLLLVVNPEPIQLSECSGTGSTN